ncbi:MAG TPA: PASTA domain-containing protein [Ignavibacteriaceae bacterium]|nr:PASTA domain-containing protein [Ignavibacteriaceae bacterium]
MKNFLQKPFVKKILIILAAFIVVILVFDFLIFPWYVSSPEVTVPSVKGLSEEAAIEKLEDANLEPIVGDTTYDVKFAKGTIILQKPGAGDIVKEGRRIYLFISGGEPQVLVPNLKGKSIRDAKLSLERIGLKLGRIEEIPSDSPRDMIFDQEFSEGTRLKKGSLVGIYISVGEGEGSVEVPDLVGKSLAEAERILIENSLTVGKINYQRSFSLLPNTVLDQYPSKGNKINPGDQVDLFITKAAEPGEKEVIE